ncbi:MAG: cytochrome P450, partial [Caldilineaceae bacterium]|nr:cytochrome P450 [Caldilineaceae bacterium]
DEAAHRHRKAMLMSIMTPARVAELADLMEHRWYVALEQWQEQEEIVLFDELRPLLCRTVCEWSGVPLPADEVEKRAKQIGARIDGAGAVGPKQWRGQWARRRTEAWITDVIRDVRDGQLDPPPESALSIISHHRDRDGELLDPNVAAVELLNVLRPTMAVGRFITFAALALHEYPASRAQLQSDNEDSVEWFAQEVRRYYPFFPFVVACVRKDFAWNGYSFPQGRRVLLDLYGTNHDPQRWNKPNSFWPERFRDHQVTPFDLIPQGGGDYDINHRCAGEWITLALMKRAISLLTEKMTYTVPEQDLQVDLAHFPGRPQSGFIMSNVRKRTAESQPKQRRTTEGRATEAVA